ncbi:MAG: Cell division protein FtsQ [Alphaproteobacteria bacterium MarineAlpha5_Bin9]|nr:MAG: Cell division protein FtsQ [Alphaproteobacteria bacterium MarineAlpha5_Bin9]|tara:strand:- start:2865 stop:3626 length:762 start_codon:yes stop_codon:yes gene_type:complete
MTINRKKLNLFNIIKRNYFFLISIIVFFILFFILIRNVSNINYIINSISLRYNFILSDVSIKGLNRVSKEEISLYFEEYFDKSIFIIPIKTISRDIKKENQWIESISIRNDLKSKIFISIKEWQPLAIYYNESKYLYINDNGEIIDFVDNSINEDLIIIFGNNSLSNSLLLINSMPSELKKLTLRIEYVNDRRWNIYTKDNLIIKLPEENYTEAMKNYLDIYKDNNFTNLDNIESIDMRIPKKAIIKFIKKDS